MSPPPETWTVPTTPGARPPQAPSLGVHCLGFPSRGGCACSRLPTTWTHPLPCVSGALFPPSAPCVRVPLPCWGASGHFQPLARVSIAAVSVLACVVQWTEVLTRAGYTGETSQAHSEATCPTSPGPWSCPGACHSAFPRSGRPGHSRSAGSVVAERRGCWRRCQQVSVPRSPVSRTSRRGSCASLRPFLRAGLPTFVTFQRIHCIDY